MGIIEYSMPLVIDLNNGKTWLPPVLEYPVLGCNSPLWSDRLQLLITTLDREILIYNPNGEIFRRYPGSGPLSLSPDGRRLLAGFVWRDLETEQTVDFSGQYKRTMIDPAWSSDETRLFECCFGFADTHSGKYGYFNLGELHQAGREGGTLSSRWVLDDSRVLVQYDFYVGNNPGVIPLIDPVGQTYQDIRALAGIDSQLSCGSPNIAPDGSRFWVGCQPALQPGLTPTPALGLSLVVDLHTFITQTIPSGLGFWSWSPDSQSALLGKNYDSQTKVGEYSVLRIADGTVYPITPISITVPLWSHTGKRLAFLAEDGRTLTVLEPTTGAASQISLTQTFIRLFWHPTDQKLAAQAQDGSLWWIQNPSLDTIIQLTPPLPDVRDVKWSPDGTQIAFVSGPDVYIASAVSP